MKNYYLLFSVCVIFILLGTTQKIHGKDETANLMAGTAKVDITPP